MLSCDTNILIYYLNRDCPEHDSAREFLESHQTNNDFAICELVLMELYILIRSPNILSKPLDSKTAMTIISNLRSNPNWRLIDYPGGLMNELWNMVSKPNFPRRKIFDARLALTLLHHGVTEFATRNTKDFNGFGFKKVFSPV